MTRLRHSFALVTALALGAHVHGQQIWDVWQTKWDMTELFSSIGPRPPLNFTTPPGAAGKVDIVVDETQVFQTMNGFGGSLTDSSALTLSNLKTKNSDNYWDVLTYLFDATDGANAAGFSYVRVPIGASDFSATVYSLDDTSGDTSFTHFNINNSPSYLFSTLLDILSINPALKVHILPWSPPGWMKTTGTMLGGSIESSMLTHYPTYLLKAVQGFESKGIPIFAISVQNEPENSNPTYPTCTWTPATEGQVGAALRTLLNNNGLSAVHLIGYEHNWGDAGEYPVELMEDDGSAYDGVAFHCYSGTYTDMATFHSAYPSKNMYFTECTGTFGSDWWSDIKWYMTNLWIGSVNEGVDVGLMFNFALNGDGGPILSGTTSCGGGCRAIVTVNSDGSYSYNQEFYAMAQASKASIPKDSGGPWGRRIAVSLSGSLASTFQATAFSTKRISSTDWNRYAIVVLNQNDGEPDEWDPVSVTATIEFRGAQVQYTFPVGVTTLWWYAEPNSAGQVHGEETTVRVKDEYGAQVPLFGRRH
ncbi:Glycoside hydrolase family 30 protein [Mycena chlorophos]|uniref:Glycoside hydrolase family 30 protein n=1 Tax=Mycena chlorophos TaxID=658473 RepID=A0A8H6WGM7_MYCCL|nr:Glycoside hydrolase family 30 protein [Mycena chlorophos]